MIGETKTGKTTLLATAAEWLWETHRKILFFNTCELGGFSSRVEQRIRQGIIRPFRMRTRDDQQNSLSFETLHLASKGYVPRRFRDHLTGEVEPGVPMVAPVLTVYQQLCPSCGNEVRRTTQRSKLTASTSCPTCKKPVALQAAPPIVHVVQTPGFEQIGSFGFDGLTSASDWLLQDMSHRKNLEGEKAALGGDVVSGDMVFRGNNRSQVGMAQTRIHELVANSLGIPNLIVMPFWTAISHESSDDTGRLQIVGPKLAGDAKTYIACSWFGNVTESVVISDDQKRYVRRLYVSQYYDEYNRRHLCGHRGDPRYMPISFEDEPYTDAAPPTTMCVGFSLRTFLDAIEDSIKKAEAENDLTEAPGMQAIPASYGIDGEEPEKLETPATGAVRVTPKASPRPRMKAAGPPPGSAVVAQEQPPEPVQEQAAEAAAEPATPAAEASPAAADDTPGGGVAADESQQAAGEETEQPVETTPDVAAAVALPTTAAPPVQAGGWTRPAGHRPPPPRAPQAGPKPPGRAAPRPVQSVKPS